MPPASVVSASNASAGVDYRSTLAGDVDPAVSGRPHFQQYVTARPSLQRVVGTLFCLSVLVGIIAVLSVQYSAAESEHRAALDARLRSNAYFKALIASRISEATSLAQAVAGFGLGYASPSPINHSGTVAERQQIGNESHWRSFAKALIQKVPGIMALEVQPSGIITHVYPPGLGNIGLDLLNFNLTREGYFNFIESAETVYVGPTTLLNGGIGIVTRFPAYLDEDDKSLATFWGAGTALFRINELLDGLRLRERVEPTGFDVLVYTVNQILNDNTPPTSDVFLSRDGITRQGTCHDPHGLQERFEVLEEYTMYICTAPIAGVPSADPPVGALIGFCFAVVGWALLALALVYLIAYARFRIRHRFVVHRKREPTLTRHAMVAIKNMAWWRENQDAALLQIGLDRYEAHVRTAARLHRCHVSGRIAEGCILVVAKDSKDLVGFAEWCQHYLSDAVGPMRLPPPSHHNSMAESYSMSFSANMGSRSNGAAFVWPPQGGDGASESASRFGRRVKKALFTVAVSVHYGELGATYLPEADHYTFSGPALTTAAAAVDAADDRELVVTEAFISLRIEKEGLPIETVAELDTRDLGPHATLYVVPPKDDSEDALSPAMRQAMVAEATMRRRRRSSGGYAADAVGSLAIDRSVLTAVTAASGSVLVKRVGLLSVELLIGQSDADVRLAAPRFAAALGRIAEAVAAMHASIIAVTGSRVVIACNALQASSSPPLRTLTIAAVVREALSTSSIDIVFTATCGNANVAALGAGLVICVGRCVSRLRGLSLLARDLVDVHPTDTPSHTLLTSKTLIDSTMAEQVRQAYELQCLGPRRLLDMIAVNPDLPLSASGGGRTPTFVTSSPRRQHEVAFGDSLESQDSQGPYGRDGGNTSSLRQQGSIASRNANRGGETSLGTLVYAVENKWRVAEAKNAKQKQDRKRSITSVGVDGASVEAPAAAQDGAPASAMSSTDWLYKAKRLEEDSPFWCANTAFELHREGSEREAKAFAQEALNAAEATRKLSAITTACLGAILAARTESVAETGTPTATISEGRDELKFQSIPAAMPPIPCQPGASTTGSISGNTGSSATPTPTGADVVSNGRQGGKVRPVVDVSAPQGAPWAMPEQPRAAALDSGSSTAACLPGTPAPPTSDERRFDPGYVSADSPLASAAQRGDDGGDQQQLREHSPSPKSPTYVPSTLPTPSL